MNFKLLSLLLHSTVGVITLHIASGWLYSKPDESPYMMMLLMMMTLAMMT